ncbi:Phosphorylase kinase, gamma catalytic subunit [Parasponia andersonii]|uniref:Phosphorylase kinase, gamma catalytic subunit n=1 Tax=Parasponia andersonii TaxID=3476 RepID=A0A2P5DDB1_PARAD|nr:Phosphorylase kinase, gamma catalytic subunit [Parasponia andersonii]
MEDKDLNRCVTSLVGSEPLCSIPCSIDDARLELTMGNSRNANLGSVGNPSSSRQGIWQYQYDLPSVYRSKDIHGDSLFQEEKYQNLLRVKEEFAMQSMKLFSTKHIRQNQDEISAHVGSNDDNKIVSRNGLLIGKKQLKTISRSSLSQLVVKKTLKGKGIVTRYPEAYSVALDQNEEKHGYVGEVASTADLKTSANNDQKHSNGIIRSFTESYSNGISLREWLISESHKVDRVESLLLFKQIVQLVELAHSKGSALQDLRPSCFAVLPSNKIQYIGSLTMTDEKKIVHRDLNKKRQLEKNTSSNHNLVSKQQKLSEAMRSLRSQPKIGMEAECHMGGSQTYVCRESQQPKDSSYRIASSARQQQSIAITGQLEKKWYTSPEGLDEGDCSYSSNIYGLGILLFELLCCFESWEAHSAVMFDLGHRILPPKFLSEHPLEAGFCLWLLHPNPSSRPTTREILQSELICGSKELNSWDISSNSGDSVDSQSELLLKFLNSLEEQKQKRAFELIEDIRYLEEDIKEVEKRYISRTASDFSWENKEFSVIKEEGFSLEDSVSSGISSRSFSMSSNNEDRLMRNITHLENAYLSMRSQIRHSETALASQPHKDEQNKEETPCRVKKENEDPSMNQLSHDRVGAFFDGLCKFARFSEFKVCGTLRNGDLFNSTNAICSLSFDRDEDYIAAAKVSRKIKIFEFGALSNDPADMHYPVAELSNKSKLSCICWNYYIKNYLASTDYDGVVKMWDAGTGQGFSEYTEHQKRAWSVDFSRADPTMFASGSDDCSVKLWSVNDKSSMGTIYSPANVCCVQFSDYSNNLLVIGSADYKIYGYDLRHGRIPLCTLAGHGKAVSYVKFLDAETLVSASTDNTLKLWDLKKTVSSDDASSLSFTGHTNEKNFVGLSVLDGYIACGSETNEVYSYHRSLPMPITSHKFGSTDPVSGRQISDDNGQFVSSVSWRRKSNMVIAANSSGVMKLLQMV